eukprot:m.73736 g.73736  ORF g.73736 m.73736 type:complete len:455 (-) comp8040_c0_seq1:872-2236(-)
MECMGCVARETVEVALRDCVTLQLDGQRRCLIPQEYLHNLLCHVNENFGPHPVLSPSFMREYSREQLTSLTPIVFERLGVEVPPVMCLVVYVPFRNRFELVIKPFALNVSVHGLVIGSHPVEFVLTTDLTWSIADVRSLLRSNIQRHASLSLEENSFAVRFGQHPPPEDEMQALQDFLQDRFPGLNVEGEHLSVTVHLRQDEAESMIQHLIAGAQPLVVQQPFQEVNVEEHQFVALADDELHDVKFNGATYHHAAEREHDECERPMHLRPMKKFANNCCAGAAISAIMAVPCLRQALLLLPPNSNIRLLQGLRNLALQFCHYDSRGCLLRPRDTEAFANYVQNEVGCMDGPCSFRNFVSGFFNSLSLALAGTRELHPDLINLVHYQQMQGCFKCSERNNLSWPDPRRLLVTTMPKHSVCLKLQIAQPSMTGNSKSRKKTRALSPFAFIQAHSES